MDYMDYIWFENRIPDKNDSNFSNLKLKQNYTGSFFAYLKSSAKINYNENMNVSTSNKVVGLNKKKDSNSSSYHYSMFRFHLR